MKIQPVHLELIGYSSKNNIILGLRRFISRRVYPVEIMRENGTKFIGGARNYARQFWSLIKTKFIKNSQQNEVTGTSIHLRYHGWTRFWKLLFVKRPSVKYLCSKRKGGGQCKSLHLLFSRHHLKEGTKVCCSRFFIYWGNVSNIFNWDWMSHQ